MNSDPRPPAERVGPGWDHTDSWQALLAGLGSAGTTVADLRYLERRQRVRALSPEGPVRYELSVDPRAVTPRRPA